MKHRLILAALSGALSLAAASDPSERLTDPAAEARARAIFKDVRCLVCQNESIDDSEAELAKDLRQIVRDQVKAGASDAQVKAFLTERYGEFVLLTPSFSWGNLALWGAPLLVLAGGGILLVRRLRGGGEAAGLTPEESRRLAELTGDETA